MSEHLVALFDALRDDPFYRKLERCYPDVEGARDAMLRYYSISVQEAERFGRVGRADGVTGLSVWSVPLPPQDAQTKVAAKAQEMEQAMGAECAALYNDISASMAEQEARLPLDGMWYLSILGVAPVQQGQGLGRALLDPVLNEADAAGVASYLTTFTPRNIPFYERQGYVQAGTFDEPVTGSAFTVLVRQPVPAVSGPA